MIHRPLLTIDSTIFLVKLGEKGSVAIHEMYSNNIRDANSPVEDCKTEEEVVMVQLACESDDTVLCDPIPRMWDRRRDFKVELHCSIIWLNLKPYANLFSGSLHKSGCVEDGSQIRVQVSRFNLRTAACGDESDCQVQCVY